MSVNNHEININSKIYRDLHSFLPILNRWKKENEKIVFTNGCFDIIHHGHIDSLLKSARLGTKLVVGLNSDYWVNKLKGKNRPVFDVTARSMMLAALGFVDAVVIFYEETPAILIERIMPDYLVKGKDYAVHEIVGHETVIRNGGKVITLDLVPDISTSIVIEKIKQIHRDKLRSGTEEFLQNELIDTGTIK